MRHTDMFHKSCDMIKSKFSIRCVAATSGGVQYINSKFYFFMFYSSAEQKEYQMHDAPLCFLVNTMISVDSWKFKEMGRSVHFVIQNALRRKKFLSPLTFTAKLPRSH